MKKPITREKEFIIIIWVSKQVSLYRPLKKSFFNTWLEVLLSRSTERDIKRNNSIDSSHQWQTSVFTDKISHWKTSATTTQDLWSTTFTYHITAAHHILKPTMTTSKRKLWDHLMLQSSTISLLETEEAELLLNGYLVLLDIPMIELEELTWECFLE